MFESDHKIKEFIKNTLIKMLNIHRDSKKSFFQIKVPVLEALKAYEIVYKQPITIGKPEDAQIIQRFEKAINDGMVEFELYCLQKQIKINKIKQEDALYYEYDQRSKKPVRQDKTIKIKFNNQIIKLKNLQELYDCTNNFNIRISSFELKQIVESHKELAIKLVQFETGPEILEIFKQAFIEHVSGMNYTEFKEKYDNNFNKQIELLAVSKGYQQNTIY